MLDQGEKVFIVHRRLFEKDTPRFFIGEVQVYENGMAKVKGYTFAKDLFTGNIKRKPEYRTKIISLVSGNLIVYQLPVTVLMDSLEFTFEEHGGLVLRDEGGFVMDISESVHKLDSN